MINNIATGAVLACLLFTVLLAIYAARGRQAKKTAANATAVKVEDWMRAQAYTPDYFNFFYANAIAFKDGDTRLLLHHNAKTAFHALSDLVAVSAQESIERERPLGAAPGVVEIRNSTHRYHLDITVKNIRTPIRIQFANKELMLAWESRLLTLIAA